MDTKQPSLAADITLVEGFYVKRWAGDMNEAEAALSRVIEAARGAELYKKLYMKAVEAASPFLQVGGQYSHLLLPGDSILERGPGVLAEALGKAEAALEQAKRERDEWKQTAVDAENRQRARVEQAEQREAALKAELEKERQIANQQGARAVEDAEEIDALREQNAALRRALDGMKKAALAAIYAWEALRTHPDIRPVLHALRLPGDRIVKLLGEECARAEAAPLRCLVTSNPCGTDTWAIGHPCSCANCQRWLAAEAEGKP